MQIGNKTNFFYLLIVSWTVTIRRVDYASMPERKSATIKNRFLNKVMASIVCTYKCELFPIKSFICNYFGSINNWKSLRCLT
jgi:hypothetical protein